MRTVDTVASIGCGYAKFKAIMLIITASIIAFFMFIFSISMILSYNKQKTESSQNPDVNPPPPKWVPIVLLLIAPLMVAGSIFYYKFIKNHPNVCKAAGLYNAATEAASFFRSALK